jgi:hypothetical protein
MRGSTSSPARKRRATRAIGTWDALPRGMTPIHTRYIVPVLAVMLSASPAFAAYQAPSRVAGTEAGSAQRAPAPAARHAAPATPKEVSRYAAREAKAPDAKRFAGGHETVVYFGASAVVVVLAIVLLIVLL